MISASESTELWCYINLSIIIIIIMPIQFDLEWPPNKEAHF